MQITHRCLYIQTLGYVQLVKGKSEPVQHAELEIARNFQNWKTEVVAIVSYYVILSIFHLLVIWLWKLAEVMHEGLRCKCLAVQM